MLFSLIVFRFDFTDIHQYLFSVSLEIPLRKSTNTLVDDEKK